jgi:tetratricopeptide (TPR) repeat protein
MLWYQVGPYQAYYNAGRYQDVIDLANTTLAYMLEPVLEESFYWRGLARQQTGDLEGAISDFKRTVELNSNFSPGYEQLERLGIQVP